MMFWIKYILLKIFFPRRPVTLEYNLYLLLNRERGKNKRKKLFYQYDLRKVARRHSLDMAMSDYFSHESLSNKSPKDRFEDMRISEVVSGENLAKVRGYSNPVKSAHDGLMASPGHRKNILSEHYNCVGIGAALSDDETYYFTQNFSHRIVYLKNVKRVARFFKGINIRGSIIDPGVSVILIRVLDVCGKKVFETTVKPDSKKFKIFVPLIKRGKYSFSIYGGKRSLRLSNKFTVYKRWFFW